MARAEFFGYGLYAFDAPHTRRPTSTASSTRSRRCPYTTNNDVGVDCPHIRHLPIYDVSDPVEGASREIAEDGSEPPGGVASDTEAFRHAGLSLSL